MTMTQTTTLHFGQSTDASSKQAEVWNGDDPYKEVTDLIHSLMLRKSGYYGNPDDGPLCNALGVEEDGIEPWRYQLARIGEKCRRLRGDAQHDEQLLRETLIDIAGHAVVAVACLNAQKNETH
jgi:hypothetical protein